MKNRKLRQSTKWRREKRRRSGQQPLKSPAVKPRPLSLPSRVTLKELRIRVRRHSLDFLLGCKDPTSKERAILQQLEELTAETRPREEKPRPLNASVSTLQTSGAAPSAGVGPAKVPERRLLHLRNSSRARRRGEDMAAHQAASQNPPRSQALRRPVETDKETSEKTEKNSECRSGNGCAESCVTERTQSAAAESSERDSLEDLSPIRSRSSKTAADNPLKSLKQYLTVRLTRLPAPVTIETQKTCSGRSTRSSNGLTAAASACPSQRASRSQHRQAASSEDGGGGAAAAPPHTPHLRGRRASESGDSPLRRGRQEKEAQDQVETQREKGEAAAAAASAPTEPKRSTAVQESAWKSRESQRGLRSLERAANKEGGAVQQAAGVSQSVNQQPARRCTQDVVIKQAKVLLLDILRKDESLLEHRLYRHLVGRFPASSSRETQREEGDERGGGSHCSEQGRTVRHARTSPRAPRAKSEAKQSVRARLGPDSGPTEQPHPWKDPAQPSQPRPDGPPAAPNTLPQDWLLPAKSSLQADSSLQAHTQSNIPLKKRTFRSTLELASEPGPTGVPGQSRKDDRKDPSAVTPQPEAFPEAREDPSKDGKCRRRRPELQRFTRKKVPAATRELRPRNNQAEQRRSAVPESNPAPEDQPSQEKEDLDGSGVPNLPESQLEEEEEVEALVQPAGLEEGEPSVGLKMVFRRRKGRVWQMQGAAFEKVALKLEQPEELVACDPFKAIMDSVSILNMEMEAARAHVHASRKSNNRLRRLKRRGERLRKAKSLPPEKIPKPGEARKLGVDTKDGLDRRRPARVQPEGRETGSEGVVPSAPPPKREDRFLTSCCMFESGSQRKLQPEDEPGGLSLSLPVLKLRRRTEDIWEVDGKDELRRTQLKAEAELKTESQGQALGKQQKGCLDPGRLKDECPSAQRHSGNPLLKTETPPFCLSLSPLSLSSPLSDSRSDLSLAVDAGPERPEMNGGGRKQRPVPERMHKSGAVDTSSTCLSHTLQQIDNSLSRLSEGLCSSQVLEKPPACPSVPAAVLQPSQSPPFAAAETMLSGETSFPTCCDDILDFQCLNFEGYYQPQNMLPSSPPDLCSMDPPTDPFSSPLSHSPSDTWTTETPYLGPPSPGNSFPGEDLHFFPGLMSSKNDCVPLDYDPKDAPRGRTPPNPGFSFSALADPDMAAKDRVQSKTLGVRHSREDLKAQPSSASAPSKPRLFAAAPAFTPQTPVSLSQPAAFGVRTAAVQSRVQSGLRNQGPFHRVALPSRSPLFGSSQSNPGRGSSHSCFPKSVPSSQAPSRFLAPSLFTLRNPNPSESPRFQTSTVIHRVLKFQEGNLDGAPCKDAAAGMASRTAGGKPGAAEKMQLNPKAAFVPDAHLRAGVSAQSFCKDAGPLTPPGRPGAYYKPSSSFHPSFSKSRTSSDKHEAVDANLAYKGPPGLPRSCFPNKAPDIYAAPQQSKSASSDKHQPCYTHQDPFDYSFGSSLSHLSQDSGPQLNHGAPPPPPPVGRSQPLLSSASFPYGYQGPPYVLNFSGDHSLTLGLRDGAEGCPGLGSANYTYHCLMEPSGTQGRLVLEPCGPQLSGPASFSLGGFSGLKGQEDPCRKDMQQQFLHREHLGPAHYGPTTTSHSMGPTKPKRVRLVVTDGTVDLDLQYSD